MPKLVAVAVAEVSYVPTPVAALADGTATTESSPAPSAVTATSDIRLKIVLLDIFFLSLVELGNFPISARRSFDLLILFPYGTHV
jgi:hypothetical protein